jgi:hypothetical protein
MIEEPTILSAQGERHRDAIAALALSAARSRRRRRRAAVAAMAVAGAAVLAIGLVPPITKQPDISQPQLAAKLMSPSPLGSEHVSPVQIKTVTIDWVRTDPRVLDRLAASPPPRWCVIDDDTLLTELAAAGHPAGLVTVGGRTLLLPE